MNKCRYCKWYKRGDDVWGECHRFPPKEILVRKFLLKYKMMYPEVIGDEDFCGEFKNKQHNY